MHAFGPGSWEKAHLQELTGPVHNKSTQILAYANDTNIVSELEEEAEEAFSNLRNAANIMGLALNTNKIILGFISAYFEISQNCR